MPTSVRAPAASEVVTVAETASTQQDLLALAGDRSAWPHLSGLRALRQTAGRGRGDRTWDTDRLTALTVSLVLAPPAAREHWSWLPMITGVALCRAITGGHARLKWPNDVVLPAPDGTDAPGWGTWRKVAGVLGQVLPDGGGCVVGVGVNLAGSAPVAWATTLRDAGLPDDGDALLERVRTQLAGLTAADPRDWRDAVGEVCTTLGTAVEISLPDGGVLRGGAVALESHGGLVVRDEAGAEQVVMAGDVRHCRTLPWSGR